MQDMKRASSLPLQRQGTHRAAKAEGSGEKAYSGYLLLREEGSC